MNRIVFLLIFTPVLFPFFGCERVPRQLTNRDIQLMSVTKISTAWIDLPDGSQLSLGSSQFEDMNAVLESLGPIKSGNTGKLQGSEYQLNYQSGMDPTSIRVKLDGDKLMFSIGEFVYVGGESRTFMERIAQLQNHTTENGE